jgi:hypothetical protein
VRRARISGIVRSSGPALVVHFLRSLNPSPVAQSMTLDSSCGTRCEFSVSEVEF